jgi:hypothetical protein
VRIAESLDRLPSGQRRRYQDDHRHGLAEQGTPGQRPPEGNKHQQVDRSVFKEVNTVGQQRHRPGSQYDNELDEKVGEVDQRYDQNDPAQAPGIWVVDDHIAKLPRGVPARTARVATRRRASFDKTVDANAGPPRFQTPYGDVSSG